MKTNFKGMNFGFNVVNAGQRNVVVEPQVIAVSTEGGFRLTPVVSRALGISSGDYVMFVSNIDTLDQAIKERHAELVAFCKERGLKLGTAEAAIAIHQEMDVWGIAKGFVEYDGKGNQKTATERLSKNDKVKFVKQNFTSMLESAMQDASQEVKDALSRDGITEDEQVEILATFVTPRELPKYSGSKTANPAGLSGIGVSLTFTDSNVWKQLKFDMGDQANKMNRVFEVDVDNLIPTVVSNGYKEITIDVLPLGNYVDKEPSRVSKGNVEE